jgi:septal ring factor EnvC (AmiA/AmiB activator)
MGALVFGLAVLGLIAFFYIRAERNAERRRGAMERAERAEEERKKQEEERRLASKRTTFAPVRAEIKAQGSILGANFNYRYEQYERLLNQDKARLVVYEHWLDDDDFKMGKLTDGDKLLILQIVSALRVHVAAAEHLTRADREAYESKQHRLFVEAQSHGHTVIEHQAIQQYEDGQRLREELPQLFEDLLFRALSPSSDATSQDLKTMRESLEKKSSEYLTPLDIAVARFGVLAHHIAAYDVMGRTVSPAERLDHQASNFLKENLKVVTPDVLAAVCAGAEQAAHHFVNQSIDTVLESFRGENLEPKYPLVEWAEKYRRRVSRPRTREDFSRQFSAVA